MKVEIVDDVFVRRIGDNRSPKLICIHGFADSGHMYAPLAGTILIDRFELVAVDLPGFGVSPRNPSVNSIDEFAHTIAHVASSVAPGQSVGLVGHSVASAIAVATVEKLATAPLGVFSIEGNLTEADAYFSGKAADWDSANEFKEAFSGDIWNASENDWDLRRYFGGVVMADADAMWELGKDARRVSIDDAVGKAYKALNVPTLYYWSVETTTSATQEFIAENSLVNRQYEVASHWPTVASPDATAVALDEFFGNAT